MLWTDSGSEHLGESGSGLSSPWFSKDKNLKKAQLKNMKPFWIKSEKIFFSSNTLEAYKLQELFGGLQAPRALWRPTSSKSSLEAYKLQELSFSLPDNSSTQ